MESVPLGTGGPQVSRVGLGLMGMSGIYGQADEAESIATIHAALDAGITLLDTGDFYGMGHNEMLLREALRGVDRSRVFIQVKFGGQRDPRGAFVGHDASPAMVKSSLPPRCNGSAPTTSTCTSSSCPVDPRFLIEDTVGVIAEKDDSQCGFRPGPTCPRRARPRAAAPTRCTRSPRCRSRTPDAGSRTASCRPSASWASA